MTGWALLLFEASGLAAGAALLASLFGWALLRWFAPRVRGPARRADLALLLGVLPALVALVTLTALVLPSVLHVVGAVADHCATHSHHRHLCAVHGLGHSSALLATGAAALALFFGRAAALCVTQSSALRSMKLLERLGVTDTTGPFPRVRIPGSAPITLAVGAVRPRVLISASLSEALPPEAVDAVLAHEDAHLRRGDPRSLALLAWAALCAPPAVARQIRAVFRDAAEEASDAEAASTLGPRAVARSLIAVARLQTQHPPALALAFGATDIERRVRALLQDQHEATPSSAPSLLGGALIVAALVAIGGSDWIHHLVEGLIS